MYNKLMTAKLHTSIRYANLNDAPSLAHLFASSWRQAYRGIIPFKELEATIRRRDETWWTSNYYQHARPIVMSFDDTLIGYATAGMARQIKNIEQYNVVWRNF